MRYGRFLNYVSCFKDLKRDGRFLNCQMCLRGLRELHWIFDLREIFLDLLYRFFKVCEVCC